MKIEFKSENELRIIIPGKTFLIGEYLALGHGPSLVLTSDPGFEFIITNEQFSSKIDDFVNVPSPAGLFYQKNSAEFINHNIVFIDHYQGIGGFGASTAQFLGLFVFKYLKDHQIDFNNFDKDNWPLLNSKDFFSELLWEYWSCQTEKIYNSMYLPSGNDLLAQAKGNGLIKIVKSGFEDIKRAIDFKSFSKVGFLKKISIAIDNIDWEIDGYSFLLFSTGAKLPTHEHLVELEKINFIRLNEIMDDFILHFQQKNFENIHSDLRRWVSELDRNHLIYTETKKIIDKLSQDASVVFSKGCGALGCDVIWLIYQNSIIENDTKSLNSKVQSNLQPNKESDFNKIKIFLNDLGFDKIYRPTRS